MDEEFKDAAPAASAASAAPSEAFRVGVKPPPFWPGEPALWFAQMEGQFTLANITADATKFYHVIAQLDHRYASEVKDIITKPPDANKYEKLKSELIKRLSESQERKVKQLLMHEELGDRKPSQFLRHLTHLAGPSVPSDFLKTLWSSRLPTYIQTVVASQSDLSLEKLSDLADKVNEIVPASPQVASTSTAPPAAAAHDLLTKQLSELTMQVSKLPAQVNEQSRFKWRSRSRSRGNRDRSTSRPRQQPSNHPHCWYHYTYGAKARKCINPCTWKAENEAGSQK